MKYVYGKIVKLRKGYSIYIRTTGYNWLKWGWKTYKLFKDAKKEMEKAKRQVKKSSERIEKIEHKIV